MIASESLVDKVEMARDQIVQLATELIGYSVRPTTKSGERGNVLRS